ncbi:DUF2268 domain-containing protein [Candidatus Galacturonibacter soehngenii]|uniref:DUF2268 domain-containing protein n=1 Tax=Candidatus Galacturonatibacter soehngenii TaxID=2307010 RepID=A0A7V7UB51_9FIRM|nr:DUF2268 domain-containing putative Zn-dependent protease [Candidatus Galacturonibacter soehngenii]KAB1435952.1 DUF2268 domain-containing protein [Candidatus Galacturonibacter soehngenii]
MEIIIQDTLNLYKEMLNLPEGERIEFFSSELLKPFNTMFEIMHMPKTPEAMGCIQLSGRDSKMVEMLEKLEKADAWNNAKRTMEAAAARFEEACIPVPEKVVVGIFLGNPECLAMVEGYTGMGSIPGYIQIVIDPNEKNLPKLNACIVHEFHHNVLFHNVKWNFMTDVTVGKYVAIEGLAESFAASMFGEEYVGPWVTGIQGADLETSRRIISKSLNVKGFMEVRKYIYGKHPMMPETQDFGMPFCGGYAVGYHVIQAYLRKTGISIEKATIIDGDEIMRASGYFEN